MALKNLFDMAKADRYTADGREALIKAQEAETEDKVYQIGEISQKTGLQKTANGWVKPKNGKQAGAKKPAEKHPPMVMPKGMSPAEFMKAWEDDAKKNGFKKGQGNEWREHLRNEESGNKVDESARIAASKEARAKKEEPKNVHGAEVDKIYERQLKRIKELKAKGFTDEQIDNDKIIKQTKEDMKNVGKTSRANKEEAIRKDLGLTAGEDMSRFTDEQIEKMYAKTQQTPEQQKADFDKSKIGQAVNKGRQEFAAEKARQKELASKTNAIGLPKESKPAAGIPDFKGMESGDYDNKLRAEGWTTGGWEGNGTHASAIFKKGDRTIRVNEGQPGKITSVQEISKPAADAAPRQLTGDTRIRVRKV